MELLITDKEKKALLAIARETITAKLEGRKPSYNEADLPEAKCGAFVTLRNRQSRQLRGCIGRIFSNEPLPQTIRTMAIQSGFNDPRFPPLSREELREVSIEISAISPMEPCTNPEKVEVGVHGLYLIYSGRSGILLPQVPLEQGWNREEYLEYICIKAGLPANSYSKEGAEFYTFTATVFEEE
ncbi:MAG: AmmeMemoRadiSam system protein A [Treponema sp.]|nr:AmmeMemoRadiSam system protein A [Treponema sp.]